MRKFSPIPLVAAGKREPSPRRILDVSYVVEKKLVAGFKIK
jgi:hypothetical protein